MSKITDPEALITEIQKAPAMELHRLTDCVDELKNKIDGSDIVASITAESLLPIAQSRVDQYRSHTLEQRARNLADAWCKNHAAELVNYLKAALKEKSKNRDSFFAGIAQKVSDLSAKVFATAPADRHAVYAQREAAEQAAEDLEAEIAQAVAAIRNFEITPDLQNFRIADGAVKRISIGGTVTS